jgi:hypothetical protein
MNKRIRFTIIFSAPNFSYKKVLDWLTPKLGHLFAGACCQEIDGIWSEDGEDEKTSYKMGNHENGIKIILSVTPENQALAKIKIQETLQQLKKELNLSIYWVHLEQEEVTAHHFQLS